MSGDLVYTDMNEYFLSSYLPLAALAHILPSLSHTSSPLTYRLGGGSPRDDQPAIYAEAPYKPSLIKYAEAPYKPTLPSS